MIGKNYLNFCLCSGIRATNPSELDLEFYYNDLQVPSKSAFTLLQNFSFNDKCRIHLTVDPEDQVITDGLIVRGVYSTITLAVYGYPVDEVPLKEPTVTEPAATDTTKETASIGAVSPGDLTASPIDIDSPKKVNIGSAADAVLISPNTSDDTRSEFVPAKGLSTTPTSDKRIIDGDTPRAIPTITTRLKFDSAFSTGTREDQFEEPIDRDRERAESDLSSDEHFDTKSDNVKTSTQPISVSTAILPEVEDAEDISDGEVFPEEDMDIDDKDTALEATGGDKNTTPPAKDLIPIRQLSPAIEPLSDQEDCLLDDFQDGGIDIVSDEELPDFPEYEYGEWEEQWTHIFGPAFNPFSENFQVSSLKVLQKILTAKPFLWNLKTFSFFLNRALKLARRWALSPRLLSK